MLFDVHCHLGFEHFDSDRGEVIKRALAAGVSVINSTVEPGEISAALKLSRDYGSVYLTCGLSASNLDPEKTEEAVRLIEEHARELVGVGEAGLDYYWVKDAEEKFFLKQQFKRFVELSLELDLPLVVHSRDAEEDCIRILQDYCKPAVMHCFSGNTWQAEKAVSFGCLISIPSNVCYAKKRQKLAIELPIDSVVLETDAPYLSPTPKTRNEPVNVLNAAQKISELKGMSFDDVAGKTSYNAKKFFRI